jgi:hypothetical protein
MPDIVLLVVAAIVGALALRFVAIRFGRRDYNVGIPIAAIAVVVVVFIITHKYFYVVLKHAHGSHHWAHSGSVRLVLVLVISALCGYWMYVLYRGRYKD